MKKSWKAVIASALVAAMVITVAPVSAQNAQAATKVKKITLSKKTCVIKKGKKLKLKVTCSPKKVKGKVSWKTSNKKVATVSKKGIVTAKKNGKAVITAKMKGKKATCKVIVGTPVKSVSVSKKTITVKQGSSMAIKAKALPIKASVKKLQYTSSNKKVATVTSKGIVTGKAQGTATVKVASTDGNNKSAKVKVIVSKKDSTVAVSGITMAEATHIMNVKETYQAKAVITPANATNKNIIWTSSNAAVASVNTSGLVTANAKGTTDIIATSASGNLSTKCTVTVTSVMHVATDAQIAAALAASPEYLYLETTEKTKLTIPEGVYQNTNLIVDMPNGEVVNNGTFASVTIKNIAKNTFEENASGNTLQVEAEASHIIIAKNANTKIKIAKTASSTQVENNGTLQNLEIASEGNVTLNGDANSIIPTVVTSNVNLVTNQNMQIEAITKFFLQICPGAENTTVAIDTAVNIPKIVGLGLIPVTVSDSGDVVTVISDNLGVDENAVDVAFRGNIADENESPLKDVDVYITPYTADYDLENIESDAKTIHLTTDENGQYNENAIKTGNYILVAKKDACMTVTQNVVITSVYGSIYTNELINMLPSSWEGKTGGVSGAVTDSKTGDKVEGLTMRIRKGKNNLLNAALKETTSDESGNYLFENLSVGYYTVQVLDKRSDVEVADRYLSTSFNVLIKPDVTTANQGVGVSTAIHTGQVRFILTWGDEESGAISDADSHLVGPLDQDGKRFHTYYNDKTAYNSDDDICADLDLDDVEYEGPETTTIYKEAPGNYSFYVHDFSNRDSTDSSRLAASNVKVEVYSGSFKMATYYMPNEAGTLWHVCDYDSRTKALKNINKVTYHTLDTDYIGLSEEEMIAREEARVNEEIDDIQDYADALGNGKEEVEAKIAEFRDEIANANSLEKIEEIRKKVGDCYGDLRDIFSYDWEVEFSDGDKGVCYEKSLNNLRIDKCDTVDILNINLKAYDEGTTVTEVTPESGMWKAYSLTASNGYEMVVQIEVNNMTQEEWNSCY